MTRPSNTGNLTRHDLSKTIKPEKAKKATVTSLKCSLIWAWISAGMQSQDLRIVVRRVSNAVAVFLSWKSV